MASQTSAGSSGRLFEAYGFRFGNCLLSSAGGVPWLKSSMTAQEGARCCTGNARGLDVIPLDRLGRATDCREEMGRQVPHGLIHVVLYERRDLIQRRWQVGIE